MTISAASATATESSNSAARSTANPAPRATRPSDDEILGLVTASPARASFDEDAARGSREEPPAAEESGAANSPAPPPAEPAQFRPIFDANPELRDAWRDAQAFRELFPSADAAREIQKLFPTAEDARAAGAQLADLAKLDTLFFSNRPEAHAELAASVYRLNPAAFRSLARMMQAIANDSAGGAASANLPSREPAAPRQSPAPENTPLQNQPLQDGAPQNPPAQNPQLQSLQDGTALTSQNAFFHSTNAAAVQGVLDAIHLQVDRLLPEGTSQGAQQRVVGEIYRELDAALRANSTLGQQLRQTFRSAQTTPETQRAIVNMVVSRARQTLPGIAKRVINEWTSAVVARSNTRLERQRAAERRVDIAGGTPSGEGRRSLMPRDIDYRRMSDADILNL
ncbi:MAG: hypothetical protein WCA98_05185 [Candidatus Acidiferrales bacterium]